MVPGFSFVSMEREGPAGGPGGRQASPPEKSGAGPMENNFLHREMYDFASLIERRDSIQFQQNAV